ncbi:MAG TPA: hypothetical protein VKG38_16445 [Solirubrobacteraceae bacterium]|nr:hypothetical protein [Solirubrobacteraceae bacterium]
MVTVLALSAQQRFHHSSPGETVGWVLIGMVCLAILGALAFWPARVAQDKGHSFVAYYIFGFFFFPLALLAAYLVRDHQQPAY